MMPTTEFIQDVETKFIARFKEVRVGWIVRHTHRVHIHLFDQLHIVVADLLAESACSLGPERMTVDSLQKNSLSVEIKSVAFSHFKCAKAEALGDGVNRFGAVKQSETNVVKVWSFGSPKVRPCRNRLQSSRALIRQDFAGE